LDIREGETSRWCSDCKVGRAGGSRGSKAMAALTAGKQSCTKAIELSSSSEDRSMLSNRCSDSSDGALSTKLIPSHVSGAWSGVKGAGGRGGGASVLQFRFSCVHCSCLRTPAGEGRWQENGCSLERGQSDGAAILPPFLSFGGRESRRESSNNKRIPTPF
jgi:hypothetical protein